MWLNYLISVFALTALVAGWGALQFLAKKMQVKNHVDHNGSCCGACENRETCKKPAA